MTDPIDRLCYRMARLQAKAIGAVYDDCLSHVVANLLSDNPSDYLPDWCTKEPECLASILLQYPKTA